MQFRLPIARLAGPAIAGLATCMGAAALEAPVVAGGSIFDSGGTVLIRRGARAEVATRGTLVQRGDQVIIPEAGYSRSLALA